MDASEQAVSTKNSKIPVACLLKVFYMRERSNTFLQFIIKFIITFVLWIEITGLKLLTKFKSKLTAEVCIS